jgi:hypothetical protein
MGRLGDVFRHQAFRRAGLAIALWVPVGVLLAYLAFADQPPGVVVLALLLAVTVFGSLVYRRFDPPYWEWIGLGLGWAVLSFVWHLCLSHAWRPRPWGTSVEGYTMSSPGGWLTALVVLLVAPLMAALAVAGVRRLLALFRLARTTRRGLLVVLVLWLLSTKLIDWVVLPRYAAWASKAKMELTSSSLGDFTFKTSLVSVVASFVVIMAVILVPENILERGGVSAYRAAVRRLIVAALALPGAVASGLVFDKGLRSVVSWWDKGTQVKMKLSLSDDITWDLTGNYATLIMMAVGVGLWLWIPTRRRQL